MDNKITHPVPGMPESYLIEEDQGAFFPVLNGEHFVSRTDNGWTITRFDTLDEAIAAVYGFYKSMSSRYGN